MREHPCLASRGRSPDCQTCSIGQAGLLDNFVDLLSSMTYTLRSRQGVQDADREEIMAVFVVKVHDQVGQFRGTSTDGTRTVKFKTWGRKLFAGTWADFFRTNLGRRSTDVSAPVMVDISDPMNEFLPQRVRLGHELHNQALRQAALAQLELTRERHGHANPFYWGGFIFSGDPRERQKP